MINIGKLSSEGVNLFLFSNVLDISKVTKQMQVLISSRCIIGVGMEAYLVGILRPLVGMSLINLRMK